MQGSKSPWCIWAKDVAVLRHRFWSVVTGADIPLNSRIAGGLELPHANGIVISGGRVRRSAPVRRLCSRGERCQVTRGNSDRRQCPNRSQCSGTSRRPGWRNGCRCASEIGSAPGGEGQDAAKIDGGGPELLHQADGRCQLRGFGEHVCENLRERWYRAQTCPAAWWSSPAGEWLAPAMHLLSDFAAQNPLAA
jgi:hypothetical protein